MDPTLGARPSRSKKGLFIGLGAFAVLALVAVLGWLFFASQLSPEQRFYNALGELLRTDYIHKDVKITKTNPTRTTHIVVDSDLSNPDSPRSSLIYAYDAPKTTTDATQSRLLVGDLVTIDSAHFAGRVTSASEDILPYGLKQNQWYAGVRGKAWSSGNPDILGLYTDSNSSVGGAIIGDYLAKSPDTILELFRANNVYTIESSGEKTTDGDTYTSYTVKEDYQKLSSIIEKMNADFGMKLTLPTITTTNIVTVTISHKTGKITEIIEDIKQGDLQVRIQTALSYPESVSIKAPDDIKTVD